MTVNRFTLDNMLNKKYRYQGLVQTILSFKQDGDNLIIVTDKKWYTIHRDELATFISDCQEIYTDTELINPGDNGLTKPDAKSTDVMAKLKGVLIESIDAVRKDPKYVNQAKAISQNVSTLTNLVKLEIQIKNQQK